MAHKKPEAQLQCASGQGRSLAAIASIRKGQAFKSPLQPNKRTGKAKGRCASCGSVRRALRDCYRWELVIAEPVSESRRGDQAGYGWPDKKPATCGSRMTTRPMMRRLAPSSTLTEIGWLCTLHERGSLRPPSRESRAMPTLLRFHQVAWGRDMKTEANVANGVGMGIKTETQPCPTCGSHSDQWAKDPWSGIDTGQRCQQGVDLICRAPDDWCDRHCPARNGWVRK